MTDKGNKEVEVIKIAALTDNYIFILYCPERQIAAVVDPAEAAPVLKQLDKLGADLVAIFNTHHHHDHVGGNRELMVKYPQLIVYGGENDKGRIPGQSVFLKDGDRVEFAGHQAQVLFVPGHTRGHIAYYFPPVSDRDPGELFCGDTLFAGGCGRLFEGTPEQMVTSLTKLRSLPDNTRIWCAHEYTLKNLQFACTIDGENIDLIKRFHEVQALRRQQTATIPSHLGLEKRTNPFLRWDTPALQAATNSHEPIQAFTRIRGMKDRF